MVRRLTLLMLVAIVILAMGAGVAGAVTLTSQQELGKALFFDSNLSDPAGQSCADCHGPQVGWTGPDSVLNAAGTVYEGAMPGRFGNRKPPASAYAGNSPILHYDVSKGAWVGGMFWDGRATGWTLGDPLAEQALGPFLNPAEQNLASPAAVMAIVQASPYADLFESVYGAGIWNDVNTFYEAVGRSIAAYERSDEVSAYSSKYDAYLKGKAKLTGNEKRGMVLFFGKAKCGACHNGPDFTDFTYDNLGVPRNPANPFYTMPYNPDGSLWVDSGLGDFLKSAGYPETVYSAEMGKVKVPTLRNVDLRPSPKGRFVKAYGHNGYFKSLEEIVHFYNTRDVCRAGWKGMPWPAPEVAENVNTTELGNLRLSKHEEKDIVAFLKTLNDGYKK